MGTGSGTYNPRTGEWGEALIAQNSQMGEMVGRARRVAMDTPLSPRVHVSSNPEALLNHPSVFSRRLHHKVMAD